MPLDGRFPFLGAFAELGSDIAKAVRLSVKARGRKQQENGRQKNKLCFHRLDGVGDDQLARGHIYFVPLRRVGSLAAVSCFLLLASWEVGVQNANPADYAQNPCA